ncbi:MAG TPA: HDOD domain-containing protein [Gammaproteobacteria bacterium]|nr:HDOD domain-containing protein [Gammaproteobacteria bacterium]
MNTTGIFADIFSKLTDDVELLPALPEITQSIRKLTQDPDCTVKIAADLLKADPGLVAYVMRVSNSVRYMLGEPPRDIEAAVLRLGLSATANLATTYATRSMFVPSSPALKTMLLDCYERATKIAVLSYLLAKKINNIDADEAMLAGLLQDIALPPLLIRLSERPEIFEDAEKLNEAIDVLSPKINALVLRHWNFDEKLIDVVRTRKQWSRDEQENLDMSDVVLIARWYVSVEYDDGNLPDFSAIPAMKKLPADELTDDNLLKLLDESSQVIEELQQMLQCAA